MPLSLFHLIIQIFYCDSSIYIKKKANKTCLIKNKNKTSNRKQNWRADFCFFVQDNFYTPVKVDEIQ